MQHVALQHFKEHAGTPARRMLLLVGDHVAGAHRAAFIAPAFAHADAAFGGTDEVPLVVGKFEIRFRLPWTVIGAEPEMLFRLCSVDELSGIHPIARIPDVFEFAKCLHHLGTKHDR